MINLTKRQLRDRLELANDAQLSAWYGISHSAVSQWAEDRPVPAARAMEAVLKRPDLFQTEQDGDHGTDPCAGAVGAQGGEAEGRGIQIHGAHPARVVERAHEA